MSQLFKLEVLDRAALRRGGVALLLMLLGALLAYLMRPSDYLYQRMPVGLLEEGVPSAFGDWRVDNSIAPVIPAPTTQAALDLIYSQLLARTYVNARGERIMLSLAYGEYQRDDKRLHMPEGCYIGQGFAVLEVERGRYRFGGVDVPARRFVSKMGPRVEPVTYWMMVGDHIVVSEWETKQAQLRHSLLGTVPDGLLFRVSAVDRDTTRAYALQDRFIADLMGAWRGQFKQRMEAAIAASAR